MPLAASKGQHCVVAEDLHANLGHRFALCRIDLAWHDRRPRFIFGKGEFAKSRTWTRSEEADVIGDFEQRYCDRVDGAVRHDKRVVRGQSLELIGRGRERKPCQFRNFFCDPLSKSFGGVEAGADRRAALGELHQQW